MQLDKLEELLLARSFLYRASFHLQITNPYYWGMDKGNLETRAIFIRATSTLTNKIEEELKKEKV